MSLTLRVEQSDGTTNTLTATDASITRSLGEQARANVTVYRDDWTSIEDDITPRKAKLYLDVNNTEEFGGRLDTTDTGDDVVAIRINSPEIDASEAEPTGSNVVYQNVGDDTIITDQVQAVPTLSAGTITQQDAAVSYQAAFASRSKVLYDLRAMTGSEFRYNSDFTVDYVDRLGSDKSANITLGPANQNVGGDFNKKQDIRENVTHIQALGAQQGPEQITATATAASYTSGRKIWKRYENKEVIRQARLQKIADELVNEYDGEPRSLTVTCTVFPSNVSDDLLLGDTVHVDYPEENINRDLRIINLTEEWGNSGHLYTLTLSNRQLAREQKETKRNDDLQRFNHGYQGFLSRDNDSYGWQPVDSTQNATRTYFYPDDVVSENRAVVSVESIKYRSFVGSAGHSHSVSVTHPSHSHDISTTSGIVPATGLQFEGSNNGNGTGIVDTITPSRRGYPTLVYARAGIENTASGELEGGQLYASFPNSGYPITTSTSGQYAGGVLLQGHAALSVDTTNGIDLRVDATTDPIDLADSNVEWGWTVYTVEPHSHDVSDTSTTALGTTTSETSSNDAGFLPGINEFNETVTNADLIVNGTTVSSNIGTGEFNTDVDISGELSAGNNTIELSSDGLGMVNLTVQTELFRRGTKTN